MRGRATGYELQLILSLTTHISIILLSTFCLRRLRESIQSSEVDFQALEMRTPNLRVTKGGAGYKRGRERVTSGSRAGTG